MIVHDRYQYNQFIPAIVAALIMDAMTRNSKAASTLPRAYSISGGVASWLMKRSFHLRAPWGFARRHPPAANVQEIVASRRGLRTGPLVAIVFGIIALDTGSALAGPCAAKIRRIEAALDALTSNPNASAVHQSLRAQMHRQPNPRSVARGQEQAIADEQHSRTALERARAADANNDEAGCLKALPELRHDLIVR
jgi:hypothetical protein